MDLEQQKCVPCEGGLAPLSQSEAEGLMEKVPGWILVDGGIKIQRKFAFNDFVSSLEFINKLGDSGGKQKATTRTSASVGGMRMSSSLPMRLVVCMKTTLLWLQRPMNWLGLVDSAESVVGIIINQTHGFGRRNRILHRRVFRCE